MQPRFVVPQFSNRPLRLVLFILLWIPSRIVICVTLPFDQVLLVMIATMMIYNSFQHICIVSDRLSQQTAVEVVGALPE